MSDVFISYSHANRETARRYARALEATGLSVWWDDALRSGEAFDEKIEQALRSAKAVVVLWSKHSVASRWVRAEATQAERNRTLVPVMIEPCERPIMFELTHTSDLAHWNGATDDPAWRVFVADVAECVAARGGGLSSQPDANKGHAERVAPSPAKPAVLILPFVNMSGDSEQEYFSDGVTEDIITDLGRVSALSVVSRNAAFALKGKTIAAAQLGREQNVSHILEGSVRKSGDRVRVTAQLVEAATDVQVWAERFDRTLDDIFAIQDEISEAIVSAMKVRLAPEEKRAIERRATSNGEAYELFIMARDFHRTGSQRMKPLIVRICQRAIDLDPNFAPAWAQMAMAQAEMNQRGIAGSDDGGRKAAERALALDPNLADAHAALGEVIMRSEGPARLDGLHFAEAALALDPDGYDANMTVAFYRMVDGRFDDAIKHYGRAAAAAPNEIHALGMAAQCYDALGDIEAIRAHARRVIARCEVVLALEPDHGEAIGFLVSALVSLGEGDRAREWTRRALLFDPDNARLRYNLACGMARLGDVERSIELLESIQSSVNLGWLAWMEKDGDLALVRKDPRFARFLDGARRLHRVRD